MKNFLSILGLLLVFTPHVFATPAEVIIIRHGEKPVGVPDSAPEDPSPKDNGQLSPKGRARAEKLVNYFLTNPNVTKFGPPTFIFPMAQKKAGSSVRAIQTVTPLARKLNIPLNLDYTRDQYEKMVAQIMDDPRIDGKVVLICWEHSVIPDIVKAFGYKDAPNKWNGQVYDRTWVLDFGNKKPKRFYDVPQNLLPGDSSEP